MNTLQELDFCAHSIAVLTEGWSAEQKASEFKRRALRPEMIDKIITIQNLRAIRRTNQIAYQDATFPNPVTYPPSGPGYKRGLGERAMNWKYIGHLAWFVTMTNEHGKRQFHVICDNIDNPIPAFTDYGAMIVGRYLKRINAVRRRDELKGKRLYAIADIDGDEYPPIFGNVPLFVGTLNECKNAWHFVKTSWHYAVGLANFHQQSL